MREFILGVVLVPPCLTFLWITTFGGSAIHEALYADTAIVAAVNANIATALVELLRSFPFVSVTSIVSMMLVFIFDDTASPLFFIDSAVNQHDGCG